MHHIPRFFNHSGKQKFLDSKHKKGREPRLERQNALKNIDYEPTTPSSSIDDEYRVRTRSLDILPFIDRTSFRVGGTEGEIDVICDSLGLTGPDDFGIPVAAWEARKMRSSSDILPRSRLNKLDYRPRASKLADKFSETVRARDAGEEKVEPVELNNRLTTGAGGRGIKGVRPPVLTPPPVFSMPIIDNDGSTWDILRSFAPDGDKGSRFVDGGDSSSDNDEGFNGEGGERESVVLSESSSFTTSNDDDSSSTTTEPPSNISPQGRFRRFISSWDNWEKGTLLGRGSFGSVYEGIADDGFFFAVKEVSLLDQGDQGRQSIYQLEQEISLLSKFEHENIVRYYDTKKNESTLYIFLELASKGSLLSLYQQYHLRDSQASVYTRQILKGLKYLHDQNVIHRDIKCANILVDTNGIVKLADFGLAKATKLNDLQSCKGTAFWMAPEVVKRSRGYGLAADIWSLGCTVLEMLTGQLPYFPLECLDERALNEVMKKLFKNNKKWCKYLDHKSSLWLPTIHQEVQQRKLLYMGLFLLIWREAANLRFIPECLCYIYHHMAFVLYGMLAGNVSPMTRENVKPAYGGEVAFLRKVITPIYEVIAKESARSKRGKSKHSQWRNYDDLNEYFWSVDCFRLGWPMRADADFFCLPVQELRFDKSLVSSFQL